MPCKLDDSINTKVTTKREICAPFEQGAVVGYIDVYLNNTKIKRVDLITSGKVDKKFIPTWSYYAKQIFEFMFKSKNDIPIS